MSANDRPDALLCWALIASVAFKAAEHKPSGRFDVFTHTASDVQICRPACLALRVTTARLVQDLEQWLGRPVLAIDAVSLSAFLDAKVAAGMHPNTAREYLVWLRAHFRRLYASGQLRAEVLIEVLTVGPPSGSSRRARPLP